MLKAEFAVTNFNRNKLRQKSRTYQSHFPNYTDQENLGLYSFYQGRKGATCLYCDGTLQHANYKRIVELSLSFTILYYMVQIFELSS